MCGELVDKKEHNCFVLAYKSPPPNITNIATPTKVGSESLILEKSKGDTTEINITSVKYD